MRTADTGTVLVVDDEPDMLLLLREYLEPEGYAVITARDGDEAWQMLDKGAAVFDVLVTDRNMPNMNGFQLLHKIKQDRRFRDLPVIFQTAISTREEVMEDLRAGASYHLAKPYDRQKLLALVKSAIDDSRQQHLREGAGLHDMALSMIRSGEFHCGTLEETRRLAPLLAQLSCNPDKAAYGLSELLVNAVEHGNLGITYNEKSTLMMQGVWEQEMRRRVMLPENREKYVKVEMLREPMWTTFIITDMGQGFAPGKYLTLDAERATDVHGRGIALSRMISFDSLEYRGNGNQVVAIIHADKESAQADG